MAHSRWHLHATWVNELIRPCKIISRAPMVLISPRHCISRQPQVKGKCALSRTLASCWDSLGKKLRQRFAESCPKGESADFGEGWICLILKNCGDGVVFDVRGRVGLKMRTIFYCIKKMLIQ